VAVFDGEWWGVWWPWMIVWAVVLTALGAAVTIFVVHRRAVRREQHPARSVNSPFYLDEDLVGKLEEFINRGIDDETMTRTQRDINEITTKAPEILAINRNRETTTETVWRASHFPDSGPNKVRSGMEDGQCRNGVGSFLPSFGTRR
jgi:hypothetical protein